MGRNWNLWKKNHFQRAGPYVGRYKGQSNSVVEVNHQAGAQRVVFATAEAGPITEAAMCDLVAWYANTYQTGSRSIAVSCENVFACFKEHPEIRLSRHALVEMTKLPERTVTRSLSILSKEKFIQKYGQGAGVRYQLIF